MSEHTLSRPQGMFFGPRISKITLSEFAVLALLISLHLYGVGVIELYGLSIAAWDCVVVVLFFLWIICQFIGRKPIQIRGAFIPLLFISFLFTAWMGVSALFSPQLGRALTMFLLQVRNLLLVLLLGILFSNFKSFDFLNKKLLTVGVGIATLGLFMYVTAWLHYSTILAAPELWKPGTGYVLDQGGALRLIGLTKDPNFYSTWIALPFFIGFAKRFSMWNLCAVAVIGLSIALAMSRGFAVAFLVSVLLLLLMKVTAGASFRGYVKKLFVGIAAVGMIVIAGYFFFSFDLQQFVKRVELVAETPRWGMWENLFKLFGDDWNIVVGAGLRGAEEALEGSYSHNTYLDVLFETGAVGFILWALLVAYITLLCLRRIKEPLWLPWVQTWLVQLVMFAAFSLAYNPFPWLLAGVLAGAPFDTKGQHMLQAELPEVLKVEGNT